MLFGLRSADPILAENWRLATSEWIESCSECPGKLQCYQAPGLTLLWLEREDPAAGSYMVRDGSRVLFAYGAIGPDDAGHSGPELLQLKYSSSGISGLCGQNGRYQAIAYDEDSGQLEFANDTLGLLPFYYSEAAEFFVFGARYYPFRFIPKFERSLDLRAVGDLLQLGYVIGDRTLWKQARRMPRGATLCCDPDNRIRLASVARLRFSDGNWNTPISELASRMAELLARALQSNVDRQRSVIIPLSGGLDSRIVAVLAKRLQLDCSAFSLGSPHNEESIIARRVAKALGIDHKVVPLPTDAPAAYLSRYLRVTEGTVDETAVYWFGLVDAFSGCSPLILPGHLGDAASGSHLPALAGDDRITNADAVFDRVFDGAIKKEGGFSEAELAACITPEAFAELKGATRSVSREAFFSNGEHNFQRLLHWDLVLRQRLYICADMLMEDCAGRVVCPFADLNFLQFVASMPYDALYAQRAYCEMLSQLSPSIAQIGFAGQRAALQPSLRETLWLALGSPEKLVGRQLGRVMHRLKLVRRQDNWWAAVFGPSQGLDSVLANKVTQLDGLFLPDFLKNQAAMRPAQRRTLALLASWMARYM